MAAASIDVSTRHAVGSEADRAEQLHLIAQHRWVRDHLTAVGEHHREIDRDSPRSMPT
jgi:hypothetical protein